NGVSRARYVRMDGPRGASISARTRKAWMEAIFTSSCDGPLVCVPVCGIEIAMGLQALELVAVPVNGICDEEPHVRNVVIDQRRRLLIGLCAYILVRRRPPVEEEFVNIR